MVLNARAGIFSAEIELYRTAAGMKLHAAAILDFIWSMSAMSSRRAKSTFVKVERIHWFRCAASEALVEFSVEMVFLRIEGISLIEIRVSGSAVFFVVVFVIFPHMRPTAKEKGMSVFWVKGD